MTLLLAIIGCAGGFMVGVILNLLFALFGAPVEPFMFPPVLFAVLGAIRGATWGAKG